MYTYDTLPYVHWKKYTFASRFVQSIRAKTPKVTYYSPLAKFDLMEMKDVFEMCFYDGAKVTKSQKNVIQIIDKRGVQLTNPPSSHFDGSEYAELWEHYQHCLQHCLKLEQTLHQLQSDGKCFPVKIGNRPIAIPSERGLIRAQDSNMMTPRTPNVCKLDLILNFYTRINSFFRCNHLQCH